MYSFVALENQTNIILLLLKSSIGDPGAILFRPFRDVSCYLCYYSSLHMCPAHKACNNTIGGYTCVCEAGWTGSTDTDMNGASCEGTAIAFSKIHCV